MVVQKKGGRTRAVRVKEKHRENERGGGPLRTRGSEKFRKPGPAETAQGERKHKNVFTICIDL